MCLLTLADRDLSCSHPECQKKDESSEGGSSFTKCAFKTNVNIGSAGSMMKRARPGTENPNSHQLFDEVLKKFKKDDDENGKYQEVTKNNQGAQPTISNDNNILIQKILMANQPKFNIPNSQYLPSYYQSNPNQILQPNNIPLNFLQNPTVMMGFSGDSNQYPYAPTNMINQQMNVRKQDTNMSEYFPDFCVQIVNMMTNQSKIIQNLKEKNDIIIESLNYVVSELQELKYF